MKTQIKLFGVDYNIGIYNVKSYESPLNYVWESNMEIRKYEVVNRLAEIRGPNEENFNLDLTVENFEKSPNPNLSRRNRQFYSPTFRVHVRDGKFQDIFIYQERHEHREDFTRMTEKDQEYFSKQFKEQTKNVNWPKMLKFAKISLEKQLGQTIREYQRTLKQRLDNYRKSSKEVLELLSV